MPLGFSLIEVLISLLLISLILFGLDAMQLYSLQQTKIIYFYQVAENQINNMSERLKALPENLDQHINQWNAENKTLLPDSIGTVIGEFPNYRLTIYWGMKPEGCEKNKTGVTGCLTEKTQLELP